MASKFKKTVLAVDDIPEILLGVKEALRRDYHVYGVTSAIDAMEFLETRSPDLFILDIDMPSIDGFALAEAIREEKKHKATPIIFLTSTASKEYVKKALETGGNDYIVKPIDHMVLLNRVQKLLP